MDTVRTVAIVGAGALGIMYARALEPKLPTRPFFVATGERLERLRKTEWVVNGVPARFEAREPADCTPPDLVLVAVKNYDLHQALAVIRPLCGPGTLVMSVLNGIDSEEVIAREIKGARVASCTVQAMDALKEANRVSWTRLGSIYTGSADAGLHHDIDVVGALFSAAGIPCTRVPDIEAKLWSKWMLNIGVNQVSAVTGARFGDFGSDASVRMLFEAAMNEVLMVAEAYRVNLGQEDMRAWFPVIASLDPVGKTSMLQDVEQGRRTEVESFSGKLVALAVKAGIDTPVNRILYHVITARTRCALRPAG